MYDFLNYSTPMAVIMLFNLDYSMSVHHFMVQYKPHTPKNKSRLSAFLLTSD
ncbi:hypothetical protein BOH78_1314 [Pichia kudriavzevii]|uniref:Uncharacterized protein n=1 Tax=Pichia kudriavzevii TaxID=4909 RepID=A0A1V2LRZ9_PICKU|nr:hypothetical protein BOH78_1314 [Pichia kudriavzevii]